ncbi:MAG: PRC-barrel domain-containing protein [Thermoplasmatota archaeon]
MNGEDEDKKLGGSDELDKRSDEAGKKNGRTTFTELRGMKVYDADGEFFGRVSDIELNQATLNPTHLIIHKGFFGEYVKVNMKYIEKITRSEINLWISPMRKLKGYRVFDSEGTEFGRVEEAEKDRNGDLEYLRVSARFIKTLDEEEELETYIAPMMPFEDMSLTMPSTPMEEGPMGTHFNLRTEDVFVYAEDVLSVHEDKIILNKKKDFYKKE